MPVVSSRAALIEVGDSIHKLTSGLHTWEVFQYLHMTQRTAQHVNLRACVCICIPVCMQDVFCLVMTVMTVFLISACRALPGHEACQPQSPSQ